MERAKQNTAQSEESNDLDRLHPSLRTTFVSLPGGDSMLTPEQLDAIFGGDRRALRDMAKLIFQTPETEQN
ncbi:MAG: hypothetical protein L6Q98_24710 [Anaerolineae bacterium]|nr:hypothetical protein [Anaerolineae bacterium]NUQ06994.1 hypothetical protein [Anaerolineae bacterium]